MSPSVWNPAKAAGAAVGRQAAAPASRAGAVVGGALAEQIRKGKRKSSAGVEVERPERTPEGDEGGLIVKLARISGVTSSDRLPQAFYFQCPPLDELSWSLSADHNEWDGLDHQRYSRFTATSLKSISFTTLLVDYQAWWHHTEPPNIREQIEELEALLADGGAMQLRIYNRLLWDSDELNMPATLRSLQVSERGGEVDARYLTMEFSQWRETELSKQQRKTSAKTQSTSVRIVKGMTLWKLAVDAYGSGGLWSEIAKANGITGLKAHDDLLAWAKKRGRKNLTIPSAKRFGISVGEGVLVGSGIAKAVR